MMSIYRFYFKCTKFYYAIEKAAIYNYAILDSFEMTDGNGNNYGNYNPNGRYVTTYNDNYDEDYMYNNAETQNNDIKSLFRKNIKLIYEK